MVVSPPQARGVPLPAELIPREDACTQPRQVSTREQEMAAMFVASGHGLIEVNSPSHIAVETPIQKESISAFLQITSYLGDDVLLQRFVVAQ